MVDDNDFFCEMVSNSLLLKGYYVYQARTGENALESVYRFNVDLVVVDVNLPDFSGVELLHRMRMLKSDILVIVVTGELKMQVVIDCLNLGADGFFIKPLNMDEFFGMVKRLFMQKMKVKEILANKLRRGRRNNEDEWKLMSRLYGES